MRVTAQTKEETRSRIVAAARNLFSSKGFGNTTTRDLAATAKIATGTLFNYFPTKESLALTLLDEALEAGSSVFRDELNGDESLEEALFAHIVAGLRQLRPHRTYVADVLEATMTPFNVSAPNSPAERIRTRHLETVEELIRTHEPADGPGASFVSIHVYWSLYLGILAFWSREPSPNQEDTLVLVDQSMRLFVASLTTDHTNVEIGHES